MAQKNKIHETQWNELKILNIIYDYGCNSDGKCKYTYKNISLHIRL